MSLLSIVQSATAEIGLPIPATVASGMDNATKQYLALANREGKELSTGASVKRSYEWSAMRTETTWTTTATQDQGAMTTLAPGFKYLINETIWNRSQKRPIPGSLTPQDWQLMQAAQLSGPYSQFTIRGGHLWLYPAPAAGQTAAFEYASTYWAQSATGTSQAAFALDTDTAVLDESLITLGLIWRIRRANGLDFQEQKDDYISAVLAAMSHDGGKIVKQLGEKIFKPGVLVPEGSWNLT